MPSSTPRTRSSTSPIPEQVARLGLRQLLDRPLDDLEHLRLVLAERPADRDPGDVTRGDLLGGGAAEVLGSRPARSRRRPALGPVLRVPRQAAIEPAVRALRRARRVVAVGVERRALVEDQRDVRAERGLHRHRGLGPHELGRAVEVGAEAHPLLLDRQDRARALAGELRGAALDLVGDGAVAHREDLEAAGVGDDRPLPALEAVQPAEPRDQLVARREEQVERVPQDHVEPELTGLAHFERLDDRLRRQRHEGGGADLAVRELERAGAGVRARVSGVEGEHGGGEVSRPRVAAIRKCCRTLDGSSARRRRRSRSCAACAPRAWGSAPRARRGRSWRRRPRGRCPRAA